MTAKTAVVTGANGFVASWIVKLLLERGYSVRGTVRDPEDSTKVRHLLQLPGAAQRLTLHKADLQGEAGFDEAMKGADFVLHVATPVILGDPNADPWRDVVNPSVEGTLIVLRAAARSATVRRVIYTSSLAAAFFSERFLRREKGEAVDESWWADEKVTQMSGPYCVGKLRAERAAFEFAETTPTNFDLISIVPPLCLGRALNGRMSYGHHEVRSMIVGEEGNSTLIPEVRFTCSAAVQDVAEAHVLVLESPRAQGRYLVCESWLSRQQIAFQISRLFPQYPCTLALEGADEATLMEPAALAPSKKIRDLGLQLSPPSVYLRDVVEDLVAMGELPTDVVTS